MAGVSPRHYPAVSLLKLHSLFSADVVEVSFYESIRKGPKRTPEPRMGRVKFEMGDHVFLATDGKKVFFHLINDADKDKTATDETIRLKIGKVYAQFDPQRLTALAKEAKGTPKKRITSTTSFDRNAAVVAYTQKRSSYKCEVKGCSYEGFVKEDGVKYIEVHHVEPLADGGSDSIDNTAAVCPNCHRKLHYGKYKQQLSEAVSKVVQAANKSYQKALDSSSGS